MKRALCLSVVLVAAAALVACSGDDDDDAAAAPPVLAPILMSTEGNNLNAYTVEAPYEKQTVITTAAEDPEGMDINGQLCFFPDDPHLLITGEDTGQPERTPGWGIFAVEGDTVGQLTATPVGRLVPTYQDDPDNYGCGVLSDGRVVTTDIGNKVEGDGDGQLIVWFPPFDSETVRYCKIDITLATPGGIHVAADDTIYVASARPPGNGIVRFSGPYPTGDDAAGGCGRVDDTGAPLADQVNRTLFIPADEHAPTPNALAVAEDGSFYVASAFTGTIAHYGAAGAYIDTVVAPPEGEPFGPTPHSTGSPFGLVFGPDGSLYFADLGLGAGPDGIGPIDGQGSVRRLLADGTTVEVLDRALDFPDGVTLYRPGP